MPLQLVRDHEHVFYLERAVERLSFLLCDKHGDAVVFELQELESEVARLERLLETKNAEIERAQTGYGVTELRAENSRLRSEIAGLRRQTDELTRASVTHAAENANLRSQVANLMATGGRRKSVVVSDEPLSERGRLAGLELK